MNGIVVITYKSDLPECARGNAKSRRRAARASKFEQQRKDINLVNNSFSKATGTTLSTLKAVSMPTVKSIQRGSGSCCLPEVAKFRV